MGGYGSGRPREKDSTADKLDLDIRSLKRNSWLKPRSSMVLTWHQNSMGKKYEIGQIRLIGGTGRPDWVLLDYNTNTAGAIQEKILVEWLPQNFGGERAWWKCPGCGSRRAVLYGGARFLCRNCHGLNYESQKENRVSRACRKVRRFRDKLGWTDGALYSSGPRAKGMHRKTFWRLKWEWTLALEAELKAMRDWLDRH